MSKAKIGDAVQVLKMINLMPPLAELKNNNAEINPTPFWMDATVCVAERIDGSIGVQFASGERAMIHGQRNQQNMHKNWRFATPSTNHNKEGEC